MVYMKKRLLVSTLVSIYFGSPRLGYTRKTNCIELQIVDPEISSHIQKKLHAKLKILQQILKLLHQIIFFSYQIGKILNKTLKRLLEIRNSSHKTGGTFELPKELCKGQRY